MKKILMSLILLSFMTLYGHAETGKKEVLIKGGYQTKFKRFEFGLEGRYSITDNIRIAPDIMFMIPKDHTIGLDIDVNAHYVFEFNPSLYIYPLAGIAMVNNYFSYTYNIPEMKQQYVSKGTTDFGLNIGAGASYDLSERSFVDASIKYTFIKRDFASFFIGYGIRF